MTEKPKAIPWRGGEPVGWSEKRACPFVIERDGERHDLDCQGHSVVAGTGGPAIYVHLMTDHERGRVCSDWYHMCEVLPELATNCCWEFQMLCAGCAAFRTSHGGNQVYFAIRRHDWTGDVHRCYEKLTLRFCPYCGAEIEWKEGNW